MKVFAFLVILIVLTESRGFPQDPRNDVQERLNCMGEGTKWNPDGNFMDRISCVGCCSDIFNWPDYVAGLTKDSKGYVMCPEENWRFL